ncbi:MAG TPA: NUDIX hydrolase [Candidatus Saccharimonadales bacterium]|nr:NUDIX hydrolase [Candidatus Saccharimonadales bacterium]
MPDVTLVAGVVLRNAEGQYLLVQEAKAQVHGLWNWPAGKLEPGETLQEAAVREAKEETNLDVKLTTGKYFYNGYGDKRTDHVTHLFRAEVIAGTLTHQADELLDTRWFSPSEIRQLAKEGKTRGEWVIEAIDMVEAGKA